MKAQPPKWADQFLAWFCRPELLEDLQGDLHELFHEKVSEGKDGMAKWLFIWWVFRSFRLDVIRNLSFSLNQGYMLKNNLKIALRVLWRDKFNSLINVLGLSIGLTCFLLMGFYVKQEVSFDHFHSKKEDIYRVWVKEDYGGDQVFFNSVTPLIFEEVLESNFPEVNKAIQYDNRGYLVGRGTNRYNETVAIISPDFFEVFDFNIIAGNQTSPFKDLNSVIISPDYALKYFGQNDPIGQILPIQIRQEIRDFEVTAVFAGIPHTSSFQFDMAISTANNDDIYGRNAQTAWFNVSPETYVLLNEGVDIQEVEEKTQSVIMGYLKDRVEPGTYQMGFQALTDIHLNPEIPLGIAPVGNPNYVWILGIIGLIVLITAVVNYATLSIGLSLNRRKEVGVRKVIGAAKSGLIRQFLVESVLVTFMAILVSIYLAYMSLPLFNELTGADVKISFELWHLAMYLGLIVFIGLTAGIYPALILSNFQAGSILGGQQVPNRANYIRRGMVVFQFVVTVLLITSTLIMGRQLKYLENKDLGYAYQATVAVPLYPNPASRSISEFIESAMEKGKVLRDQLLKHPEISNIGMGSHVFGTPGWGQMAYTDDQDIFRQFTMLVVDPHYLNAFDIQVKEGRAFEEENGLDKREGIMLNQAAVEYFGLTDPIGAKLPGNQFGQHSIIGITDDFHYSSLHNPVEPLVICQNIQMINQGISDQNFVDSPVPKLIFRYESEQLSSVEGILKAEWKEVYPGEELAFNFVEENISSQYEQEKRMSRLLKVATLLSILVASLGLLGMTVLVINSRIREIGIRKIVGASEFSIFSLLAKSFAPQLLLGILISVPLTILWMRSWLANFAYRINLDVDLFLLSALISIFLAIMVISYHTLKAARVNPVESIRRE